MSFVLTEHCAVDMNSINIITGSTAATPGLLSFNRSLNTSRLSVDRRSLYASSSSMAAAMVASKGHQGQEPDDHHHKLIKVNDPVVLRTCTVDESFRRMEVGHITLPCCHSERLESILGLSQRLLPVVCMLT